MIGFSFGFSLIPSILAITNQSLQVFEVKKSQIQNVYQYGIFLADEVFPLTYVSATVSMVLIM